MLYSIPKAVPGCFWLPGAASDCPWLLLRACGCPWQLLAAPVGIFNARVGFFYTRVVQERRFRTKVLHPYNCRQTGRLDAPPPYPRTKTLQIFYFRNQLLNKPGR